MKIRVPLFLFLVLTALQINARDVDPKTICDSLAKQVVTSLGNVSPEAYVALLPPLDQFLSLMNKHPEVYGGNLSNAKEQFTKDYNDKIVAGMETSFLSTIKAGRKLGIDWTKIIFEKVTCDGTEEGSMFMPFTITFSLNKKMYQVQVLKGYIMNADSLVEI